MFFVLILKFVEKSRRQYRLKIGILKNTFTSKRRRRPIQGINFVFFELDGAKVKPRIKGKFRF